jgi:hypothetical protein
MKMIVALVVALGVAGMATAPAFAASHPKTQAACEKHHMKWDATTKKCTK